MRTTLLFMVALPLLGQGLPMGPVFSSGTPACTGYAAQGSVVIPAASGSTQTNFTVVFTGTNSKFKTLANGGLVQNTVTRIGQTVPADLIVSLDAACASGVTWGWDFYDPITGDVKIWAMIPSYSSSGATTLYVDVGNVSVTTYQGGAQGAEFDSVTKGAWHVPDGTTISAKDFSAAGGIGDMTQSAAAPTAIAGQIDGAVSFDASAGLQYFNAAGTPIVNETSLTVSAWIKTSSTSAQAFVSSWGTAGAFSNFLLWNNSGVLQVVVNTNTSSFAANGTHSIHDNAWHLINLTWSAASNTLTAYLDGVSEATVGTSGTSLPQSATGGYYWARAFDVAAWLNGTVNVDNVVIAFVTSGATGLRSADWIATEYANQSSPPVIAAF